MPEENKKISDKPKISIVVLNWNGYGDTIECIESLADSSYDNFEIILVDNASADNSVAFIKEWLFEYNQHMKGKKFRFAFGSNNSQPGHSFIPFKIIENTENLGFAKANNIGIEQAIEHKADYVLLLNNDTKVASNALQKLVGFFQLHSEYSIATPQIRYFDKPDIIWNCGGKLTSFGSRKYFFDDKSFLSLPANDSLDITFITGCAMFAKSEIFRTYGSLTEAFFFGEEDYEFSLRMKKLKVKMACVLNSVIFHKVNSSISKASANVIGKIYIHYLNRFINLRSYMSSWKWQLWRHVYIVYIFALLKFRHKIDNNVIRNFNRSLLLNSAQMSEVNKATFEKYINNNFE